MIKKTVVLIRKIKYIIKFFFNSPIILVKQFFLDLKKDKLSKNIKIKPHIIWCAGLPKSGTTLIEEILEYYAVSAKKSLLRLYDDSGLDHVHGISEKLFSSFPKNKIILTFQTQSAAGGDYPRTDDKVLTGNSFIKYQLITIWITNICY